MTPRTRIVVGIVSIMTMMGGVAAKAESQEVRAFIPFDFTVASASLPAGTYTVSPLFGSPSVVQLRTLRKGAILMTQPDGRRATGQEPQLTFHRYGERYFLHVIRLGDDREYTVPRTSAEREFMRARAEGRGPEPTVVTVAAVR